MALPRSVLAVLGALVLTGVVAPSAPPMSAAAGPRIVAIGDVHGAFDQFVEILQAAGLIDGKRQWAGGTTVFIQRKDINVIQLHGTVRRRIQSSQQTEQG